MKKENSESHGTERRNLSKERNGVMIGGIFLDLTFRILIITVRSKASGIN